MTKPVRVLIGVGGIILIIFALGWFELRSQQSATGSLPAYVGDREEVADTFGLSPAGMPGDGDEDRSLSDVVSPTSVSEKPVGGERLIIKTGTMSMVVSNVPAAIKRISDYAIQKGGFVVTSETTAESGVPSGSITVRIPSAIFADGVAEVKGMGEVTSERVDGQDVTEEYVDLDIQVKNLRAAEQQFLVIMKQAVKIQDILDVERELTNVRGQIDRITGRMKYLETSAKLSTLTVYVSTDPSTLPVVDRGETWKPLAVVKDAAHGLLGTLKGLVNGLIRLVIFIPIWGGIVLIVWLVYRWVRGARTSC